MVATTYVSLDVALTITSILKPGNPPDSLHSIAVFILTSIWPGLCVLFTASCTKYDATFPSAAFLYFVLMLWIVVRRLREQRPLIYYLLAGILFVLAQLAYFLLSRPICNGTNAKIDGSFIATVLETAAVVVLYLAWQGITEGSSISRQVCAHYQWSTCRLLG
jgi:hypothetical protein